MKKKSKVWEKKKKGLKKAQVVAWRICYTNEWAVQ